MLYVDRMPVTGGKFPNREVYVDFDELKKLNRRAPHVVFSKARRFADGSLMEPTVAEQYFMGNPAYAIVIDDLCRGGRTTCNAAKAVKERMGVKTGLFCVAHTEDTVYTGPILNDPNVGAIYTTDSCLTRVDHGKLHVLRAILSSRAGEAA